jgi:cyclin B
MEGRILDALDFNITINSSYLFLNRYSHLHLVDNEILSLARYLIELALIEYGMLKFSQRNIAASSLYLACKILKVTAWTSLLELNSDYTERDVRPCAKSLCIIL